MEKTGKKRGFAIELAVCFMVIIFLFCSIITSAISAKKIKSRYTSTTREEYTELDQVGDKFIACVKNNENFFTDDGKYNDYPVRCYVGTTKDGSGDPFDESYYEQDHGDNPLMFYYCLHVYEKGTTVTDESEPILDVVFAQVKSSETEATYQVINWSDQPLDMEKSIADGGNGDIEWEDIDKSGWEELFAKILALIQKFFEALVELIQNLINFLRQLFG